MPRITIELLRKRSEHNECVISTLEEISLHQEELEKIEVIGSLCRKLRILYLQNNIIEKIEDLTHMKELRYLNLALNNISKIEGLQACEFLEKLDLTVNFVDFDELEDSIDHLKPLQHLGELYMMGNPSQSNWANDGFREYVIAALPQVRLLDGKDVSRSDRIKALQVFPDRQRYVREQAVRVRAQKALEKQEQQLQEQEQEAEQENQRELEEEQDMDVIDIHDINGEATDISAATKPAKTQIFGSNEKVPYTPHTRREMYMELAEQKEEEDAKRRENQPRERNTEAEHEETLRHARRQEQHEDDTSIRQCNEGKWDFRIFDEDLAIVLEIDLPRFLDTSLVDVDVHPSYVSLVIKNKLFRLRFPELVHSDSGTAERSKVTGTLRLTLPKANVTPTQQLRAQLKKEEQEREAETLKAKQQTRMNKKSTQGDSRATRTTRFESSTTKKLSDEMLEAARVTTKKAVNIRGLVKKREDTENENNDHNARPAIMKIVQTKNKQPETLSGEYGNDDDDDEDAPPCLF